MFCLWVHYYCISFRMGMSKVVHSLFILLQSIAGPAIYSHNSRFRGDRGKWFTGHIESVALTYMLSLYCYVVTSGSFIIYPCFCVWFQMGSIRFTDHHYLIEPLPNSTSSSSNVHVIYKHQPLSSHPRQQPQSKPACGLDGKSQFYPFYLPFLAFFCGLIVKIIWYVSY